ncbi:MAG: hypothetical protein EXS46_00730 [Candidatus Taylorbacteria bacterium]|nr:hypothetical protein [Candidatus Taylorbacteria bacterium]
MAEKARALVEIIIMINEWCGIKHLGVRSAKEEFQARFLEKNHRPKYPRLTTFLYDINTRLIPLYVPLNSTGNILAVRKKSDSGKHEFVYSLLFVDTECNIVRFKVNSKDDGNMIDFPYEVIISIADEAEVAEIVGQHPLVFDYCLRQLIKTCGEVIARAHERIRVTQKSVHMLITVREKFAEMT